MRMIDVLIKLANGEIKDKTILKVYDHTDYIFTYTFDEKFKAFRDKYNIEMAGDFNISNKFLNYDAELIPPKEKKYLVKFNMRWIDDDTSYLNYDVEKKSMFLSGDEHYDAQFMTHFTKQELKSIQPVREFLEDMEGKYELIEVEDNEID